MRPVELHSFDLLQFAYEDQPVRVVVAEDDLWIAADDLVDLCRVGYGWQNIIRQVEPEDRLAISRRYLAGDVTAMRADRHGNVWLISEAGAYELVLRHCHAEHGRAVRRWLTRDLGPAVRALETAALTLDDLPVVRRHVLRVRAKPLARYRGRNTTDLYRLYDEVGELLYVGMSFSALARMVGHRTAQKWWREVCTVEIEPYPDRRAAHAAEVLAIETEKPRYNINHRAA